jgi:hypothetical protein
MLILLRIDSFDEELIMTGHKIQGKGPVATPAYIADWVAGWYCGDRRNRKGRGKPCRAAPSFAKAHAIEKSLLMFSAIFAASHSEYILFVLVIECPPEVGNENPQFHWVHVLSR